MNFIVSYWWLILIIIAAIAIVGYGIMVFIKMPSNSQLQQIREWLLYAVAKAEKELGGGTGQLKLRYVYDMFISKFNYLSAIISFEAFSMMVDEVLEKFRNLLDTNTSVQEYIEKK